MAYGQGVLYKDGSVIEYHGTEIKKLIVNEGVTGIGGSLCYNLPYLKSVFLPESVTKIGYRCLNINSVISVWTDSSEEIFTITRMTI